MLHCVRDATQRDRNLPGSEHYTKCFYVCYGLWPSHVVRRVRVLVARAAGAVANPLLQCPRALSSALTPAIQPCPDLFPLRCMSTTANACNWCSSANGSKYWAAGRATGAAVVLTVALIFTSAYGKCVDVEVKSSKDDTKQCPSNAPVSVRVCSQPL